jgi:RNA polymerase subunit RPABC4/transcription elongation factor Spt4
MHQPGVCRLELPLAARCKEVVEQARICPMCLEERLPVSEPPWADEYVACYPRLSEAKRILVYHRTIIAERTANQDANGLAPMSMSMSMSVVVHRDPYTPRMGRGIFGSKHASTTCTEQTSKAGPWPYVRIVPDAMTPPDHGFGRIPHPS